MHKLELAGSVQCIQGSRMTATPILAAATLGTIAFNEGKSRAPWCSSELKELTKGLSHEQDLACCKAFINAWDDANLATPFEF